MSPTPRTWPTRAPALKLSTYDVVFRLPDPLAANYPNDIAAFFTRQHRVEDAIADARVLAKRWFGDDLPDPDDLQVIVVVRKEPYTVFLFPKEDVWHPVQNYH